MKNNKPLIVEKYIELDIFKRKEDEYYIEEYNSLTEFVQHENISYSSASNWINGRSPVPYNIRRIYYKNNIEKKYERK